MYVNFFIKAIRVHEKLLKFQTLNMQVRPGADLISQSVPTLFDLTSPKYTCWKHSADTLIRDVRDETSKNQWCLTTAEIARRIFCENVFLRLF